MHQKVLKNISIFILWFSGFCIASLFVLLLTACSLAPANVFQSKVPTPIVKQAAQIEGEKRAADLIARKIETPVELVAVAESLSNSIGKPEKPIVATLPDDLPKAAILATADLNAGSAKMEKQISQLNRKLYQLQGKEIEGTGFSLLGPGMGVILIGMLALSVVCPPALTFMFFAFRRLKAAAGIVVNQLEDAAKAPETRDAITTVKSRIKKAMAHHPQNTDSLKNVILDLKKA